jgi:hypothetical protein
MKKKERSKTTQECDIEKENFSGLFLMFSICVKNVAIFFLQKN